MNNHNQIFNTLRTQIEEMPVNKVVADNQLRCFDFISNHLYKEDESIADILIGEIIKSQFNFTPAQLKPLYKKYRELHNEYGQAQALNDLISKHKSLASWYESTAQGIKVNTGLLAETLADTQQVINCKGQYYQYRSGVYVPIDGSEARLIVKKHVFPEYCKMYDIIDAENQWQLLINKRIEELNQEPYLINLKNGIYDVEKAELKPHTPEFLSTIRIGVNYDLNADCPIFKKYLCDAMEGDIEQVTLIQEILGYCLIPITAAQKCFVFVGKAGAGKSVLLNVLNEILLGKDNVSNISWQALNERFKPALLFGKLANTFADLPTKNIDDNGIFKSLTGEDRMAIENKHKDAFSFKNYARLLFSCNSIPKNYGDRSEGFYRRLIIIRFDHSVPEEMRDPHLLEKLRNEADGIFMFALEGLHRLIANEYKFSEGERNRLELKQYREESDSALSFFNDCCTIEEGKSEGSTYLYERYQSYCRDSGLLHYSQKKFVQTLMEAHPVITRGTDMAGARRILNNIEYHFEAVR